MPQERIATGRARASLSRLGRGVLRHTHLRSHPRLVGAAAAALLLYFLLAGRAGVATRFLIAADGGVLVFLTAVWLMMASATPEGMRRRAEREDEGRYTILVLSVAVATSCRVCPACTIAPSSRARTETIPLLGATSVASDKAVCI